MSREEAIEKMKEILSDEGFCGGDYISPQSFKVKLEWFIVDILNKILPE